MDREAQSRRDKKRHADALRKAALPRRAEPEPGDGFLDVLSIGRGHLRFKFDKNDPANVAQAKKVLGDMLRRGYMLFVEVDGKQQRVRAFDVEREEYIIEEPDDLPPELPTPEEQVAPAEPVRRRGRPPGKRIPMRHGRATSVGPIAGG